VTQGVSLKAIHTHPAGVVTEKLSPPAPEAIARSCGKTSDRQYLLMKTS